MNKPRKVQSKKVVVSKNIERYAKTNSFAISGKLIVIEQKATGRPSIMTKETVAKLELAFVYDCTVEEACLYAGISPDTYYAFCKKYPEFCDRITLLRNVPIFLARMTLITAMQEDAGLAMKYLQLKRPQEFNTRAQAQGMPTTSDQHYLEPEQEAAIHNAFSNYFARIK